MDNHTANGLERVAGVGAPGPRSPWWLAFLVPAALLVAAYLLREAPAGGWDEDDVLLPAGALLLMCWQTADVAGSLLWLRQGRRWGRTLRALGAVLLMPGAFAFYALASRDAAGGVFSAAIAVFVAWTLASCAYRLVRELRRRRVRGGSPRTGRFAP